MNKQGKRDNPKGGIEWTHVFGGNTGYTWNPIGGCKHGCRWQMPDGEWAECYAKTVAENVAVSAFPNGFEDHYWRGQKIEEPYHLKEPAGIFLDSMSDLMGAWVPEEQVWEVLRVVKNCDQHVFMLLTKNAPRLLKFQEWFPPNLWVGVSMPPTMMFGKKIGEFARRQMFFRALSVLRTLKGVNRWMSFEPLSFAVGEMLFTHSEMYGERVPLEWAVIGAASHGRKYYQPDPKHVEDALNILDYNDVPVFFKGNLEWPEWREEFPKVYVIE